MNHEQMIKDVYYMSGLLEGLSCLQWLTITEGMAFVLADCVDRLELIGAQLFQEVNRHEGTREESYDGIIR